MGGGRIAGSRKSEQQVEIDTKAGELPTRVPGAPRGARRFEQIDTLVDKIIAKVEAGEAVYVYGTRIRRAYKVPRGWRYRVVAELEDGRRLEMPPSVFLDRLWNKSELLRP